MVALRPPGFVATLRAAADAGQLVVQPRMGFGEVAEMRDGLEAVEGLPQFRAGTITVDSYTRLLQFAAIERALRSGERLNGFPIVTHGADVTTQLIAGLTLPVQVRHGSPLPGALFATATAAGIDAIEGGPVSYCLPYGRVPLRETVPAWREASERWAEHGTPDRPPMIETFGGCMMGQLCGPSLLIALSVLEAIFFAEAGNRHIGLSYAQGTSCDQDVAALRVLGRLAREALPDRELHCVLYTFMGLFPRTPWGARRLLEDSARVAVRGGAARLIVKTTDEAREIPSVASNVRALGWAQAAAAEPAEPDSAAVRSWEDELASEARRLVDAVRELNADIGAALIEAFARGLLDVPYCTHPDNRNKARVAIDAIGALRWRELGALPLARTTVHAAPAKTGARPSEQLLAALEHNRRVYDASSHAADEREESQ